MCHNRFRATLHLGRGIGAQLDSLMNPSDWITEDLDLTRPAERVFDLSISWEIKKVFRNLRITDVHPPLTNFRVYCLGDQRHSNKVFCKKENSFRAFWLVKPSWRVVS